MPKRLRALLFWSFVSTFFILAPLLVLYTFGFRYNIQTGRIEHTGVISLSTIPRSATVTINDKLHRSTTPTLLKQLRPKEHQIALKKDGFHSWEKDIRVIEQETVFFDSIVLWAAAQPNLVTERGDIHLVNPTRTALASLEEGGAWTEVWVEDLEKGGRTLMARFPGSKPENINLSWSPNGERLLLASESDLLVSRRDGSEQLHPQERLPGIQSLWWDEGAAEDLIVATGSETWRMRPGSGEITTVLSFPVLSLLSHNDRLFFTRERSAQTYVISRRGTSEEVIAILPTGSYQFIESRLPHLLLFEEGRERITLLDADDHDQPILLQTEARQAFWSPLGDERLLYTNGFETHLFSPWSLRDTLVDRVSRPITSVAWHPAGTAIVLAHPEGVVAYDLHEPGFIQTKLNDARNVSRVFIDDKGESLFFLGTIDDTYGLYRQSIR